MAALTLGAVYEQTRLKYQLKILAGESGLHRSLRWLYFSEDINNASFLRGGELMVLTGHSFAGRTDFEDFVHMLMDKHSCGVIVNVGKYIMEEDISQELIDLCQREEFPLITMPWKYHLTDILQDYSQQIFFRRHEQDRLIYIFQILLRDASLFSPEDEARLLANAFLPTGSYCVAVLACRDADGNRLSEAQTRNLLVLMENHLNQAAQKTCVFVYQNQVVLLYHALAQRQALQEVNTLMERCGVAFPAVTLRCGVGTQLTGVESLAESYQQAQSALFYSIRQGRRCASFEDMGMLRLLFACRDQGLPEQFAGVLTPLEDYDLRHGSQLTETLRLYLQCNGSVQQVSEQLYCHRNTTNYRIKKIKSLLELELDSTEAIFRLQMAFCVREYQQLCAQES